MTFRPQGIPERRSVAILLPLLLGALWPLAYAPFHLAFLAFLLLGPLFWLVAHAPSAKRAALMGYAFGFGAFSSGVYWLSITLHNFAHMDWALATAMVALLAAYCALWSALAMGVARRFFRGTGRWIAMPVLWVLAEYLRARFATGFPWLAVGYTQTWAWLGGYAPWLGQYGVGLATAGIAALGAWVASRPRESVVWSMGLSGILLILGVGLFAATARFTHPVGKPLQVRLVQGDIPISEKWNASRVDAILTHYAQLIATSPAGTQLVVLPETAFPVFQTEIPRLIDNLKAWSARHHTILFIGIPESAHGHYYNALMDVDGQAPLRWYRKQHLVPFGEYIPFPHLLAPLVHHFLPGLGSFTPGDGPSVLPVDGQLAGMSICYEESFSRDVRKGVVQGATFFTNSSDYAWYGHSTASAQTLQMAAMQSLQEQKPDIRATNTGITSVIDPQGRVVAQLPQFMVAALNARIQPMAGETPFGRYGNWPYLGLSALLLIWSVWVGRRSVRTPH